MHDQSGRVNEVEVTRKMYDEIAGMSSHNAYREES